MDLRNHCLFCLERVMPFILFPSSENEEDAGLSPDFQSLCSYLKISLPKKENTESVLSSSCDELLCLSCFEMVDQLKKLHRGGAPPEIGKRIGEVSWRIREVILAHDISADLPSNKRRRLEFEKELGSGEVGRREDNDCLAFVEMFQTLVKDLDLESSGIGEDSMEELTACNASSSTFNNEDRRKEISSNCDSPEINVKIEEVEMNIELNKKGLGSSDEEEDPLADFHSDMVDSDSPYDPSDASSMESEGETSDEEDLKPDVMTQPTDKNRKTQCQSSNETNSIPRRTKRRLRQRKPSHEPSIKPPSKKKPKEDKPIPQFKCPDCELLFTDRFKRATHQTKSHPRKLSTIQRLVASIPQAPTANPGQSPCKRICTICGKHVKIIEKHSRTMLTYMEHMLSHDEDGQSNSEATGPHSCTKCDKQFNLKVNLDLHIACIHDARLQLIRCHMCRENTNYGTREQLIEHLKSAHGDNVYSCKHCDMSFILFEKLLDHMKKHTASKRLLCPECDGVYTTVRELYEHCLEVHPQLWEKYNCERCEKSYLQSYRLHTHMEMKHGFDRKSKSFKEEAVGSFSCPHCKSKGKARVYKIEAALRFHISNVHLKRRNHKCDQCENKFFESKTALRKHVESVHERIRYPCHICPKAYAEKFTLNDHLKTHTGEGLFICEICSKQYRNMYLLKRHVGTTHATEENSDKVACEECGKEFLGEYKLKEHKSAKHKHRKVKKVEQSPAQCPTCGRQFTSASNLIAHKQRKHSDSVPKRSFKCVICNTCVREKGTLKTHLNKVHGLQGAELQEKVEHGIGKGES